MIRIGSREKVVFHRLYIYIYIYMGYNYGDMGVSYTGLLGLLAYVCEP